MAKISSYVNDSLVTLSDRLIGSDNENANQTKNYLVGDIIALAQSSLQGIFVPYIGAVQDVNIGLHNLFATEVICNLALYAPTITSSSIIYAASIVNLSPNPNLFVGTDSNSVGLMADSVNNLISIGDVFGTSNSCTVSIDDSNNFIVFSNGSFNMDGVPGYSGDILISNAAGVTPTWKPFSDIYLLPYLAAHSYVQQTAALVNTGYPMTFVSTDLTSGITITNNVGLLPTRITFTESGKYNIQFSVQFQRTTGGASAVADVWFRKGGADILSSNRSVNLQANAGYVLSSWNFFTDINVESANPYVEIMWAVTDINIIIAAALVNAVHPATPSVIVTVSKVSS
jgi:hypothetical protein